jgi:alginate O-acetyltransferase complex protein AlgI
MLFNTFSFFLVFLPVALVGYFFLSKVSLRLSISFLLLASVVFYSYWDIAFLPLLLCSVATNYAVGRWISRKKEEKNNGGAKLALTLGLVFNLGLLSFFKYLDFFIATLVWVTGADIKPLGVTLPIGISFFTFTQIAYLMDCHSAEVREYKPENYGLFVTYFPHLIAGPILHHKDMMPQFDRAESHVFVPGRLVVGMLFFAVGLFKKVVLADGVARFVAPVFDIGHAQLTSLEAWCGALAYTFQLYFDFSAYSDMAYGLSYMFGILLPINFNSPYKACSIIDFWRRWHMTLSAFLRDYLYIPLGGNRLGRARRYFNLFITMLLGGLWHGANWTFVIWGGLHGMYLVINHAVRRLLGERKSVLISLLGWLVTFLAVVVGWVFFRAASLDIAIEVLRAMAVGTYAGDTGSGLLGVNRIMAVDECMIWLGVLAVIAFLAPNAYEMIGQGMRYPEESRLSRSWGGFALGAILTLSFLLLAISETRGVSEFLYFNF